MTQPNILLITCNYQSGEDGTVTLKVDGKIGAEGKASGSIPLRPGRKEATLPFVHVGVGHDWGTSIGDCDDPET